jgi:HAD superfamily hydrolase (TIGR01549 family)
LLRNKSTVQAVIFDIDGTLVDSVDLHAQAWKDAFEKFGKIIPFHHIRRQIGKGSDQLLPVFFSKEELEQFGDELDQYRGDLFKKQYLPRVKAFPKVRELFQRIRKDGKQIVLASSAKADELEAYKKIAQIEDLVESETSSDDADRSKPYPDIFQAALAQLRGVTPDNAIVIGDTPYDAQAASKVNLETVGLLCGGWTQEELQSAGCLAVYRDAEDLLVNYDSHRLAFPPRDQIRR